ncbi:MAG: hypothetical protein JJT94_01875, partial [Bernardetiaceae bacterium]|nr:hypothetical protein [Bernardetiaceae bacterium]
YRFGFNGMENDKDLNDGAIDFGARIYDSRIGRWLSVDPLTNVYADLTPYHFTYNSPLMYKDPDGRDGRLSITKTEDENGKPHYNIHYETTFFFYGNALNDEYDGATLRQRLRDQMHKDIEDFKANAAVMGSSEFDFDGASYSFTFAISANIVEEDLNQALLAQYKTVVPADKAASSTGAAMPVSGISSDIKQQMGFEDGDNLVYLDHAGTMNLGTPSAVLLKKSTLLANDGLNGFLATAVLFHEMLHTFFDIKDIYKRPNLEYYEKRIVPDKMNPHSYVTYKDALLNNKSLRVSNPTRGVYIGIHPDHVKTLIRGVQKNFGSFEKLETNKLYQFPLLFQRNMTPVGQSIQFEKE